jgi:hypothetical protein
MTNKINLTLDNDLIKEMKSYARKEKTSVSKIVQEQMLTRFPKKAGKKKSFVEKYAGIIKDVHIGDIDKARDEYLKEKYGV